MRMTGLVAGRVSLLSQTARDGDSPRDAEQRDENEAKNEWRRPGRSDAEACYRNSGAGSGDGLVKVPVVLPGLQACGYEHRRA
jgi:hypothetical protein